MSKIKQNSNLDIYNSDLQIEDISSSKALFSNSFKRNNTKNWYNNSSKEDYKNSEIGISFYFNE